MQSTGKQTDTEQLLREGISRTGIPRTEELVSLMIIYLRELELFNAVRDLVGADSTEDIVIRHILDSLAPYPWISAFIQEQSVLHKERRVLIADAGSGAGFPGIPLAAAFPEADFVLIERMSRRCAFLENCAAVMGLYNVTVENREVERLEKEIYDAVVFRAFRPLDSTMIRTLFRTLVPQGYLAAYKGKKEKIEEEMAAIKEYALIWKAEKITVPFLLAEERHLVLIPRTQTD